MVTLIIETSAKFQRNCSKIALAQSSLLHQIKKEAGEEVLINYYDQSAGGESEGFLREQEDLKASI